MGGDSVNFAIQNSASTDLAKRSDALDLPKRGSGEKRRLAVPIVLGEPAHNTFLFTGSRSIVQSVCFVWVATLQQCLVQQCFSRIPVLCRYTSLHFLPLKWLEAKPVLVHPDPFQSCAKLGSTVWATSKVTRNWRVYYRINENHENHENLKRTSLHVTSRHVTSRHFTSLHATSRHLSRSATPASRHLSRSITPASRTRFGSQRCIQRRPAPGFVPHRPRGPVEVPHENIRVHDVISTIKHAC
jgi:hypothetical protein